eukprot:5390293-Ditylum_brightwellii.AAC.1
MAAKSTVRALDVNIYSILPSHKCPPGYKCNTLGICHKKLLHMEFLGNGFGMPHANTLIMLTYTKEGKRRK